MCIRYRRVAEASVTVDGKCVSAIGRGLLVLVGIEQGDTVAECLKLAAKTVAMRIFDDENGVMNRSVADVGGEILAVSQFTLLASTRKGNRPSYVRAAGHELATELYELYISETSRLNGKPTGRGIFGADMKVALVNDGPVTIIMDTRAAND
ncbi:MAG: D-tyrosyl-tRNA(Tyr) deacylase [Muribaculaceae bacterium]|nr:D-tyrosyl-tRNA(Tyr) deacylase [Muribaculaceae bacterium]